MLNANVHNSVQHCKVGHTVLRQVIIMGLKGFTLHGIEDKNRVCLN